MTMQNDFAMDIRTGFRAGRGVGDGWYGLSGRFGAPVEKRDAFGCGILVWCGRRWKAAVGTLEGGSEVEVGKKGIAA